ncbi:UDP-glycosyltransferase UGT41D1 [Danaus plexippus plexippus]|uniref:UDP-glucuronosyltransferase n=1 Tax=Danaus plexippus plexippus TaxID=278856 RepID=A0A212ERC8_DANPL|nr:UDP-glycosyltransferase UGT41D1 [Danaus plexippus plexippus]
MLTDVLTVWKSFVHVYMRTMTMKRLILFLSLLSAVFGHHILCIQNVPSRSHHTLMMGIVKPLLEAGHQVTMITTFPEEKPAKNLRYIDVGHLRDLVPKSGFKKLGCNVSGNVHFRLDQSKMEANYVSDFSAISSARGVPLPPYNDALYNVSVLLVNSHPSFAPARSLPPNVVDIAGYHMDENLAPLPKDLQDLLDSSTKGVVYFSMGSVLKSANLPEKTKEGLIKVFSELPYTVLWKFEEKIEGLPKNVHVRPWMPQSSILSHPNVLVFITHGGLLSTLESLYHGIPIIAIPVFGDQPGNAKRCVQEGRALMVSIGENMAEDLNNALKDMLGNDSYYKKAKELSKLFRSRPVKPNKLIQHYVELAIESKGAYHLRSKTHLYKWYELWMLDQIAFVLAVLAIAFSLLKKVAGLFMTKQKQKGKKEKKN